MSGSQQVVKVISPSTSFTTSRLLRIQIRTSFPQHQREQSFYDKNEHKLPANQALCFGLTCFVYTSRSHVQLTNVGNNVPAQHSDEDSDDRLPRPKCQPCPFLAVGSRASYCALPPSVPPRLPAFAGGNITTHGGVMTLKWVHAASLTQWQ